MIMYHDQVVSGGDNGDTTPIGTIIAFAGGTPNGYLYCDGSAVSRTTYPELFAVIGTTYGSGNGSSTFNLPDLRGKFPQGFSDSLALGKTVNAGLPNLYGTLPLVWYNRPDLTTTASGVFVWGSQENVGNPNKDSATNSSPSASGASDITVFNAKKYNSIYGNSSTVQPPAVTVRYCIKALYVSGHAAENAVVNDSLISANSLWSSSKINSELTTLKNHFINKTEEITSKVTKYLGMGSICVNKRGDWVYLTFSGTYTGSTTTTTQTLYTGVPTEYRPKINQQAVGFAYGSPAVQISRIEIQPDGSIKLDGSGWSNGGNVRTGFWYYIGA